MAPMMRRASDHPHHVFPDIGRPQMAKADVRNPDIDYMRAIGRAIELAVDDVGWTNQQAANAAEPPIDDAEFGKWINGTRRPQLDRLLAIETLRNPLAMRLAALGDQVEIVTEVRYRRQA